MNTIFINSENSLKCKPHVLILNLTDKLDLRRGEESTALSNLRNYYTWKNIKVTYNKNIFKISTPMRNDKFELSDGSYSVSDIQDYFDFILKKHGENIEEPLKVHLELLTSETMKSLGSAENEITKDKYGENVPHLEITEVVLVHCDVVNNDYQQDSRVLYTFVPNKRFGNLS